MFVCVHVGIILVNFDTPNYVIIVKMKKEKSNLYVTYISLSLFTTT